MAFIKVENLNFTYHNNSEKTLENINFEVMEGEFVVVCGESGCGKSTLLKMLKKQLQPSGVKSGTILFENEEIEKLDERKSVTDIGFVMQNPDNQIVTDKVWHELAFGLESLGESTQSIRRKVAEISGFFGITSWYRKKTSELSGGQKQLLNLASIMVMNPKLLILDEPTSQLDPIAATEFIGTLKKINDELGVSIILVEHRLEEVFPIAHKIILMNKAKILMVDTPKNVGSKLYQIDAQHKMNLGMPSSVRIYNKLPRGNDCPLTVREGKEYLKKNFANNIKSIDAKKSVQSNNIALEIKEGFFRYERNADDILNGLDLKVYENEFLCILGGNGAGKTTTLKVISGLKKLYRGKFRIWGKKISEYNGNSLYRNNVSTLPQNPQSLFVKSKVIDDLTEVTKILELKKDDAREQINNVVSELGIENLLQSHPYDLSGGEQQKVAFAKILLMNPKIILLDEPTKGIDAYSKSILAKILQRLKIQGKTIVMVTHDVEFAAEYADRCAMFFDGGIVSIEDTVDFFAQNRYYTTASSRISRNIYDNAITVDMVCDLAKLNERECNE